MLIMVLSLLRLNKKDCDIINFMIKSILRLGGSIIMKKTKIICSVGPKSNQVEVMKEMVNAGMNVGRINFSHATIEEREQALYAIRECRKITGKPIAILWDTKGPEFRGGVMENDGIDLVEGKLYVLLRIMLLVIVKDLLLIIQKQLIL